MAELIDRFNAMLQTIPGGPGLSHVQYVDLRNTFTSDIQGYKKSWGDELLASRRCEPNRRWLESATECTLTSDLTP